MYHIIQTNYIMVLTVIQLVGWIEHCTLLNNKYISFVQLKDLLTRSINSWVHLFEESNKDHIPLVSMELVYEESEGMIFYPSYDDLQELVVSVVKHIANTLQAVRLTIYSQFSWRYVKH